MGLLSPSGVVTSATANGNPLRSLLYSSTALDLGDPITMIPLLLSTETEVPKPSPGRRSVASSLLCWSHTHGQRLTSRVREQPFRFVLMLVFGSRSGIMGRSKQQILTERTTDLRTWLSHGRPTDHDEGTSIAPSKCVRGACSLALCQATFTLGACRIRCGVSPCSSVVPTELEVVDVDMRPELLASKKA